MTTIMGQLLYEPAAVAQALTASAGLAEMPEGAALEAALAPTFFSQQPPVKAALSDFQVGRKYHGDRGVQRLSRALATVKSRAPVRYTGAVDRIFPNFPSDRMARKDNILFREVVQRQVGIADTSLWDLADLHRVFLLMNQYHQLLALIRPPQTENGEALYIGKQHGDPLIYISHQQLSLEQGPLSLMIDGGIDLVLHRRNNGGNVSVQRADGKESAPSVVLKDDDRFLIGGGFYLKLIALHDALEEVPAEPTRISAAPIDDSPPPAPAPPALEPTAPIRDEPREPITGVSLHNSLYQFSVGLADDAKVTVGRFGIICIDQPSVSRTHAHIRRDGDEMILQDLGSTNGTFVNGVRIDEPHSLHRGDMIKVGDVKLVFDFQRSPTAEPITPPAPVAKTAVVSPTPPPPSRSRWRRLLDWASGGE